VKRKQEVEHSRVSSQNSMFLALLGAVDDSPITSDTSLILTWSTINHQGFQLNTNNITVTPPFPLHDFSILASGLYSFSVSLRVLFNQERPHGEGTIYVGVYLHRITHATHASHSHSHSHSDQNDAFSQIVARQNYNFSELQQEQVITLGEQVFIPCACRGHVILSYQDSIGSSANIAGKDSRFTISTYS